MSNLQKLKIACDILLELGEYNHIQCIAVLHWDKVPEAAKQLSCTVGGNYRIAFYQLGNTRIADISGYGLFQII